MKARRRPLLTAGDGLLAGAVAGLAMSLFMIVWDWLAGDGVWTMPQLVATILLGPAAYEGGHHFTLMPTLVGFSLHTFTSAAMGLAFILLLRLPAFADYAIANTIVYGLVAGVVAEFWLIPLLSQTMARHTEPLQLFHSPCQLILEIG